MGRIALVVLLAATAAACSSASHVAERTPRPSSNPYVASLAYARCLRAHNVPHPNPNKHGDFNLTPAQEQRLRSVPPARREAAMKACFHNLAGLNNQPLSNRAHHRAIKVLMQLKRCMQGFGYALGTPIVRNMSLGRAMFGFTDSGTRRHGSAKRYQRAERVCERRVDMARKISRIIAEDRRVRRPGGF